MFYEILWEKEIGSYDSQMSYELKSSSYSLLLIYSLLTLCSKLPPETQQSCQLIEWFKRRKKSFKKSQYFKKNK